MNSRIFNYFFFTNTVLSIIETTVLFVFVSCYETCSADEEGVSFQSSSIIIENYSDSEIVHFPVVLLVGRVVGSVSGRVVVENYSSASPYRIMSANICDERFKILVELVDGVNHLAIASKDQKTDLYLFYRRSANSYFVRLILFTASSGNESAESSDGYFGAKTPEDDETKNIVKKVQIAATLWQTATAERLYNSGYGRRTFTLERDSCGEIVVWKQQGKKAPRDYSTLSEVERFREIYREIISGPAFSEKACYFVLTSLNVEQDQSLDDEKRVALGCDGMAMLDSRTLFAWPVRLDEIDAFFSDSTPITSDFSRDSAFRNVRWALTASSLGAGLHELGHAFGLRHCEDHNDFMSRGFDRFNRIFTVVEPPSCVSEGGIILDKETVEWTKSTAPILIRSFWIAE